MEIPKAYNPKETEERIYKMWEDSGYFNPDKLPDTEHKEPYTIVMPPPNVTGILSIGHALMLTIEDVLIRFKRMQGKKTLWVPGTDHAAIATQAKVEADLYKKESKTKHDFSREEFLKIIEKFAKDSHDTIVNQTKKMGASADWSREAYTLDEPRTKAVYTAFKKMYDAGLIYRGSRIVNWDPKLKTTVSDDEIEWRQETSPLYYLKYGPFTIATARPETKFGDKYVVMHPGDARYKKYNHGDKIEVEWINGAVTATVIKDETIDMAFGTGAMTITPAHDNADFDIAQRHKLDFEQIIDLDGKLLPVAGEFADLHIKKARPLIIEKLQKNGLLKKTDENYAHRIATNSRGGGLIEPQIMKQWFIDVNAKFNPPSGGQKSKLKGIKDKQEVTLKQLMRHVVESGQIKIIPDHFAKIYYHWIDNLRDWCISRQIWYGHRIPVWYRSSSVSATASKVEVEAAPKIASSPTPHKDTEEIYVGVEPPPDQENWEQDPDTLDTWFSSGLWTFSTLGWPHFAETATRGLSGPENDFANYHPTDVLETGYDILFFWVARMILMTTYLVGDIPFRTVYLHGLIRAPDRQKMSKSKGNIVDPLDVTEKYGTDALRFALIFNTSPGTDQLFAEDKVKGMKHFANKLWNISRFVLTNLEIPNSQFPIPNSTTPITDADREILDKLEKTIKEVTENLENFRLHEAAQSIYQFTWHEFADVYIEASKEQLKDPALKENTLNSLLFILNSVLKLLHPFMPFVTEEIWQNMNKELGIKNKDLLMVNKWPN